MMSAMLKIVGWCTQVRLRDVIHGTDACRQADKILAEFAATTPSLPSSSDAVEWEKRYRECRALLQELVYLKSIKGIAESESEYEERKPMAWAAAKIFLGNNH